MKKLIISVICALALMATVMPVALALEGDERGEAPSARISMEAIDLNVGVSSPQEYAKGMTVPLNAQAPSGADCEYKFVWMKDNWNQWGVIRDFSPEQTCEWAPTEAGSYILYLDIRDANGRTITKALVFEVLESWNLKSFSAHSAAGSCLVGDDVAIEVVTEGNNSALTYKFVWMKDNWNQWGVIQDWSTKPSCVWTPSSAGDYQLYLDVKDSTGTIRTFQIPYLVSAVRLQADAIQSRFSEGMEINLQASAGADVQFSLYKFVWMKDNWAEWGVIQHFSSMQTCVWSPSESGDYTLFVDAMDSRGKIFSVSLDVQLTEDWKFESFDSLAAEPLVMGSNAKTTLSVATSGNNWALEYKFVWMKDNWNQWGVIRDFDESPLCDWTASASGDYTLYVDVRNSAGSIESFSKTITVERPWSWEGDGVIASPLSQKPGEPTNISACVSGETEGLTYKFVWMKDNWNQWGVIQDWSSSSVCTWAPAEAGDYTIYVDVLDQSGEVATATTVYGAWEYKGVKVDLNYMVDNALGCVAVISPDMGCSNPVGLEYKFVWMKDNWAEWGVIQDWSTESRIEWVPDVAGMYTLYIDVKTPDGEILTKSMTSAIMKDPFSGAYQHLSSATRYLIVVDCAANKVCIYEGSKNAWNVIKYWDCASGAPSTPTVKGTFTIGSRGYYFDSEGTRLFYWTQFCGDYLFHSTTYYQDPTPQQPVDDRVGVGISHGCVRLKLENAKWIYDNIPWGTKVLVF